MANKFNLLQQIISMGSFVRLFSPNISCLKIDCRSEIGVIHMKRISSSEQSEQFSQFATATTVCGDNIELYDVWDTG